MNALDYVYDNIVVGGPVVIVASSLGCQVISNYIWDAQRKKRKGEPPKFGIWRQGAVEEECGPQDDFRRLKSLRALFTTGCNIPLFVSGHSEIEAILPPNPNKPFEWKNYYDEDDVLGWPLRPLSDSYCRLVAGWLWPRYAASAGSLAATSTPSRYQPSSVLTTKL